MDFFKVLSESDNEPKRHITAVYAFCIALCNFRYYLLCDSFRLSF